MGPRPISNGMEKRKRSLLEITFGAVLVVGLAIGMLSFLEGARVAHRDSVRIQNVQDLTKALELYYTSNGSYPVSISRVTITGTDPLSLLLLTEGYLRGAPRDPLAPTFQYTYRSNEEGTDYEIGFCLETDRIQNRTKGCDNVLKP